MRGQKKSRNWATIERLVRRRNIASPHAPAREFRARAVIRGRREGIAPLLGAVLMTASFIHDALLAPGYIDGVWLGPFGATAFVFGICGAFLVRYSRLRVELPAL